jgi:hypothetical protein
MSPIDFRVAFDKLKPVAIPLLVSRPAFENFAASGYILLIALPKPSRSRLDTRRNRRNDNSSNTKRFS